MFQRIKNNTWLSDGLLLTLVIGLIYFLALGIPALYFPDEGRYAEIGREMLVFHNFVTPHLDGLPYFEKPPLAYWCIAFFEWTFGMSEWSVRAPDVCFGLIMCLSVYSAGRVCYNRLTGIWAALILSSSLLFFAITHLLNTDACLSAALTLALTSFISWFKLREEGRSHAILLYLAYAGCALAVLAKGLIGMVFPGLIIIAWLLFTWNWKLLKHMRLFSGILLFLVIAAPWHILAERQNPTFYYEYFYVNHFLRYTTPVMHREMHKLTYIGLFIGGFLPWVFVLFAHFKTVLRFFLSPRKHPLESFFIWWILAIFLFFGFSDSILPTYLLPTLPPLALFTAPLVAHLWQKNLKMARCKLGATLVLSWLILNIAWIIAPPYIDKSTKPLALTVNHLLVSHPNALLVNYNYYFQDFPFYTQHFIEIANWQDELTYGQSVDPSRHVLISNVEFWNKVKGHDVMYVVMKQYDLDTINQNEPNTLFLLAKSGRYVLVTNWAGVAE